MASPTWPATLANRDQPLTPSVESLSDHRRAFHEANGSGLPERIDAAHGLMAPTEFPVLEEFILAVSSPFGTSRAARVGSSPAIAARVSMSIEASSSA
jgi:hypothetical protein